MALQIVSAPVVQLCFFCRRDQYQRRLLVSALLLSCKLVGSSTKSRHNYMSHGHYFVRLIGLIFMARYLS